MTKQYKIHHGIISLIRRIKVVNILNLLCLLAMGCSEKTEPIDTAIDSIEPKAIEAHVKFLGDDLLEGRKPGERGFDLAANYIATQFQLLGLQPAGIDSSYFQPVKFLSTIYHPGESSISLERDGVETQLIFGEDFLVLDKSTEENSYQEGELVYVNYGIDEPTLSINDYEGLDVKGKIAAYKPGAPKGLPAAEQSIIGSTYSKMEYAKRHGAVGVMEIWTEESDDSNGFERMKKSFQEPSFFAIGENNKLIDAENNFEHIAYLSKSGTEKIMSSIALPEQNGDLNVSVKAHKVSERSTFKSANVLGMLRGSDPILQNEYVVYTAHLDHLGIGEPIDGDSIYNGVTDNAGSVAMLLEVARAFKSLHVPPKRSVIFLMPTAEEMGLLGSNYFLEYPTVPKLTIVANVNMDGSNLLFDFKNIVDIGGDHSSLGLVVQQAARKLDIEAISDPMPEQVFFIRSDHYSFVKHGIPALFPMTGTIAVDPNIDGAELQKERFRIRYHKPADDLLHPLDFKAGAKTAKYNFLLGYYIAQEEMRPIWNESDYFGKRYGTPSK